MKKLIYSMFLGIIVLLLSACSFMVGEGKTVTFYDGNHLVLELRETVSSGTQITLPDISKTGYEFDGWLQNGMGTPLKGQFTVTDDTIFRAKWTPLKCKLKFFEDNGDIIDELTQIRDYNEVFTLPERLKKDMNFDGWLLNNTGAPIKGSFTVKGETEFYAKWSDIEYTVTFYDRGQIVDKLTVYNNTQITLPDRERADYYFNGWLLNNTVEPLKGEYVVNDNTTFYAQWSGYCDIRFFDDAKQLLSALTLRVPNGTIIDLPDSSETGFDCDWQIKGEGKFLYGKYTVNGSVDFYAASVIAITNFTGLDNIRNNLSGNYRLTADISAPAGNWVPLGSPGAYFKGKLNGDGHVIRNLRVTGAAMYSGLFGYIDNATVINLGLENADINGVQYAGGIAGYVNNGTITNCYSAGNLSSVSVSSDSYAGGIAGYVNNGTVTNCYSTVNITSSAGSASYAYAGGIAGAISAAEFPYRSVSEITNCYSTGNITSTSSVTNNNYAGGIVGKVVYRETVKNCVAINPPIITSNYGRIVGHTVFVPEISNNFALNTMPVPPKSNEFWYKVTVKTDAQLKTFNTYSAPINGDGLGGLGWSFGNNDNSPWKMPAAGGYPILYWQTEP
ncbi:MAG: InlB B-repeat-containing protein [Deferribacteraceae bacterium]|jgi:uncharacterized repeat protein (TIGR02543 family)|nr:InlB B-repeat-containing protein [Deferribacteraceae bacterium]